VHFNQDPKKIEKETIEKGQVLGSKIRGLLVWPNRKKALYVWACKPKLARLTILLFYFFYQGVDNIEPTFLSFSKK
jgi:hypothetical protein